MKSSRRKFTRTLALGAAAVPFVPEAVSQQEATADSESIDLSLKVINVKMNDDRTKQIRDALQNTARQVAAVRAYRLRRDTPPALGLGVFDT
jgi:hypothetical protein